jgi:hypothetical protein
MPVDIQLITTILRVLNNAEEHRDYTEELVGLDIELILRRPIPTHQIRDALVQCRAHGWAVEASDDFGQPIWKITEAGRLKVQHP